MIGFGTGFQGLQKEIGRSAAERHRAVARFPNAGRIPIPKGIGVESPRIHPTGFIANKQPAKGEPLANSPQSATGSFQERCLLFHATNPENVTIEALIDFEIRAVQEKERLDLWAQSGQPGLPAGVPQGILKRIVRKNQKRNIEILLEGSRACLLRNLDKSSPQFQYCISLRLKHLLKQDCKVLKVLPSNNCKAGLFEFQAEVPGKDMTARERSLSNSKIWLMLMLTQASLAVKALREAGIPCLMLKGGAGLLAGWLKVERRPVTDIDLLIPPERLEEAARILTAKGWSPAFRPYLPCDARRHSHPVSSPEGGLLVDIHWFSLRHARWPGVDDVLWQGAWRAELPDGDVLIPSPEDFLVHTVAHGRRAGSPGSLWRKDVRTLLEHPNLCVDWHRVERTAQNYRIAPMVAAALEEVRAEAPNCVSDEICTRLRRIPAPLSDRLFLQLIRRFPEEIGFGHAVIVGLDFFRTRPCSFSEAPWAFVKYPEGPLGIEFAPPGPGPLCGSDPLGIAGRTGQVP